MPVTNAFGSHWVKHQESQAVQENSEKNIRRENKGGMKNCLEENTANSVGCLLIILCLYTLFLM